MRIRDEEPADADAVRDIHLAAFGAHGADVAPLVEELRPAVTAGTGLSLIAELDDEVIGHAMFTPSLLDAPRRLVPVQVLSPIGVAPAHQRGGAGRALIAEGVDRLNRREVPLIFLEGDPGYYSRLGFEPAESLGFRRPSLRIPEKGFQVMRLDAWRPWMTGTLVYAEVFWRMDVVGLRDE